MTYPRKDNLLTLEELDGKEFRTVIVDDKVIGYRLNLLTKITKSKVFTRFELIRNLESGAMLTSYYDNLYDAIENYNNFPY